MTSQHTETLEQEQVAEPVVAPARYCLCGCEGSPKGKKALFCMGHDSRVKGVLNRVRENRTQNDERIPKVLIDYCKENQEAMFVGYSGKDILNLVVAHREQIREAKAVADAKAAEAAANG